MESRLSVDQVVSQATMVAESILKFVETSERDSSTALLQENILLKEIEVAFDGLTKLISTNDVTAGKAIAESLSEMDDFLRLLLRLMKEMTRSRDCQFYSGVAQIYLYM